MGQYNQYSYWYWCIGTSLVESLSKQQSKLYAFLAGASTAAQLWLGEIFCPMMFLFHLFAVYLFCLLCLEDNNHGEYTSVPDSGSFDEKHTKPVQTVVLVVCFVFYLFVCLFDIVIVFELVIKPVMFCITLLKMSKNMILFFWCLHRLFIVYCFCLNTLKWYLYNAPSFNDNKVIHVLI